MNSIQNFNVEIEDGECNRDNHITIINIDPHTPLGNALNEISVLVVFDLCGEIVKVGIEIACGVEAE